MYTVCTISRVSGSIEIGPRGLSHFMPLADGDALVAAAKGMKWESPRGPISIDPETRDIVQTVYIRRLEKVGGKLLNVEIDKIENVKDPVKERMKK